jgi:hypothetical protein
MRQSSAVVFAHDHSTCDHASWHSDCRSRWGFRSSTLKAASVEELQVAFADSGAAGLFARRSASRCLVSGRDAQARIGEHVAGPERSDGDTRLAWGEIRAERAARAVLELVFSVLQEGDQVNKGFKACQLLHRNHENGLEQVGQLLSEAFQDA